VSLRREVTAVLGLLAAAGVVLLVREPALGLAVLAGVGAGALVGPRARVAVAVAVLVLGAVVLGVGITRPDAVLVVGGAAVVVASAVGALRVRRWPAPRGGGAARRREPTARDTWDALDRGEDPTA
jgi:hypothetical protein